MTTRRTSAIHGPAHEEHADHATYPSVARPNHAVEPRKNAPSGPRIGRRGRSSSAASAGLSVSALNAEITTDTAMVTANCWYMRPVMPGTKAVGTNTATRIRAMATTGPETSSIAFSVASRGARPCSMWCSTASTTTMASSTTSPMASTRPNSDSVLMEKPSRGNTAKVPTSDTGTASSGMRVARNALEEDEHHQDDQGQGLEERLDDLLDARGDGERGVERHDVVQVLGEPRLHLLHQGPRALHRRERVRARELVDGDHRRRLAVEPPLDVVGLRAQLDARHVLDADHRAVGARAHDDVAEVLRRLEPARRPHGVGELLAGRHRVRPDLAGGVRRALRLDGADRRR